MIEDILTVKIDRPIDGYHSQHKELYYHVD